VVGRQGVSDTRRGVPRWPGAVALLSIEAYYLALSKFVVVLADMAQYFDLGRWKKRDASSVLTLHEQP
jgi:hypothetical protein